MSESRRGDDAARVEELLRVNAALAAEIRNLAAGRADAPRPAAMPASRRLAALTDERDRARERLEALEAEADALRAERDALADRDQELSAEVARLRSGARGALRRVRGRLLRPRGR